MGKSAGSPPPAPDYKGAAEATASSQRTSQYTPYGSQVYSPSGYDPQGNLMWQSNISLTPQAQQTLDTQMGLSQGLGNLSLSQLPGVQDQYSKPMDMSSVQDIADKAYGNYTARLDPQWNARTTQEETKLINQGLRPGDEAYTNAMRDFNAAKNDAYTSANTASINTMPQTYSLASQQYTQPLNILNAIRSGAQIQNPQFGNTPGTNYSGAANAAGQYGQGLYNADVAQANAANQGMYSLGGMALLGAMLSDRRLKRDIERIGEDPRGFGIYRFRYLWDDAEHIGVMADEVERVIPSAVFNVGGFKAVNYGAL